MLSLAKKLDKQRQREAQSSTTSTGTSSTNTTTTQTSAGARPVASPALLRDRLLVAEVQQLHDTLPATCQLHFPRADQLHELLLTVRPGHGTLWHGGAFVFTISVPVEYNIEPPAVRCRTRLWHPNIDEQGAVCLSVLRTSAFDRHGWLPTRTLKDVVWGVEALFHELLNYDDPLNVDAADHYRRDAADFQRKVSDYVRRYASDGS